MHGRGCQHATDGDAAGRAVDLQLLADPGLLVSLGVALHTNIAMLWELVEHLCQCHAQLTLDPTGRLDGTDLVLAGTAPRALGFRGRRRLVWLHRFLAHLDRRAVARDVPDQAVRV